MPGKKGKGKKGKGAGGDEAVVPFVPMPRTWPGKLSDPDLFSQFATQVRQKLAKPSIYHDYVALRIRQLDWEFHDFVITLPKSASLYRLKQEIAEIQHCGSIFPLDIIIYRKAREFRPHEDPAQKKPMGLGGLWSNRNNKNTDNKSGMLTAEHVRSGVLVPCENEKLSIAEYFPDIAKYVLPVKVEEEEEEQSPITGDTNGETVVQLNIPASRPASALSSSSQSKKKRGSKGSKRAQSASTNRSIESNEPYVPPPPPIGKQSVVWLVKSTPVTEHEFIPKSRPYSAPIPYSRTKQTGAHFAEVNIDPKNLITIFYDVASYINHNRDALSSGTKQNIEPTSFQPSYKADPHSPILMRETREDAPKASRHLPGHAHGRDSPTDDPSDDQNKGEDTKWKGMPILALAAMKHLALKSRASVARNRSGSESARPSTLVKTIDKLSNSIQTEVDKSIKVLKAA